MPQKPKARKKKAGDHAQRNNGRELEVHILGKFSPNWVNVLPKYGPLTPTHGLGSGPKARFSSGPTPLGTNREYGGTGSRKKKVSPILKMKCFSDSPR